MFMGGLPRPVVVNQVGAVMFIELNTKLPGCWEDQDRLYAPALENLKRLYQELVPLLREAEAELQAEFGLRMQWDDDQIFPEPSRDEDGFLYFHNPSIDVDAVNEKGYPVIAQDRWEEEGRPYGTNVFEPLRDLDWSNLDKLKDDSAPAWIQVSFCCYREYWGKGYWDVVPE